MKTMLMLMIALAAPVMALELPEPGRVDWNESATPITDKYFGNDTGYGARAPQVVVPIPPSESGPSYYGPQGVMTDKQFCNYVFGAGLRCYSR